MKNTEIIAEIIKASSYSSLLAKEIKESSIADTIREYLPKLIPIDKNVSDILLRDEQFFGKIQKLFQLHLEAFSRQQILSQQSAHRIRHGEELVNGNKKITRAALARRHQKNQEQIRKDQIFVRLTPKSQTCIQFMLCNRNFPRMEVKLSCNQHLEYLINYLTNKWLRGKVGYKVILFPDTSFLKTLPISEKEKALKQPLNNYFMFTDVMTCCGVSQNGVLNLSYEIVESKKQNGKQSMATPQINKETNKMSLGAENDSQHVKGKQTLILPEIASSFIQKPNDKQQNFSIKINSPSKYSYKQDFLPENSIFNKNSNFFANNEESMFGSLGFNFNFGITPNKREELFSYNSNNGFQLDFKKHRQQRQLQRMQREEKKDELNVMKVQEQRLSEQDEKISGREQRISGRSMSNNDAPLKQQIDEAKQNSHQRENNEQRQMREEQPSHDKKLGNLMSLLDQMEREKEGVHNLNAEESQNNNSNRVRDVKTVCIVKKRNANI